MVTARDCDIQSRNYMDPIVLVLTPTSVVFFEINRENYDFTELSGIQTKRQDKTISSLLPSSDKESRPQLTTLLKVLRINEGDEIKNLGGDKAAIQLILKDQQTRGQGKNADS